MCLRQRAHSSTQRQRRSELCEFKVSLVYRVSQDSVERLFFFFFVVEVEEKEEEEKEEERRKKKRL